jgi:hypothetical protein
MSGATTTAKRQNNEVLDEAVARALSDNLAPLKRTVEDLQKAFSDLVAQLDSNRGSAVLPNMLRAQSSAASLAAGLGVLSSFVAMTLQPRDRIGGAAAPAMAPETTEKTAEHHVEAPAPVRAATPPPAPTSAHAPVQPSPAQTFTAPPAIATEPPAAAPRHEPGAPFDLAALPADLQELHRRAKRVAKVAMQDIKMLKPKDVRQARENKEICVKLRDDLDKARKEYDRRFKPILDHPVDYFHDSMVAILADGDAEALGSYPYPSPALRH